MFWTCNPAPYVLAYYAIGTKITFVAICPPTPSEQHPTIQDVLTFNLQTRAGWIKNAVYMINMGPIVAGLADMIGPIREQEYLETIKLEGFTRSVTTSIERMYQT